MQNLRRFDIHVFRRSKDSFETINCWTFIKLVSSCFKKEKTHFVSIIKRFSLDLSKIRQKNKIKRKTENSKYYCLKTRERARRKQDFLFHVFVVVVFFSTLCSPCSVVFGIFLNLFLSLSIWVLHAVSFETNRQKSTNKLCRINSSKSLTQQTLFTSLLHDNFA